MCPIYGLIIYIYMSHIWPCYIYIVPYVALLYIYVPYLAFIYIYIYIYIYMPHKYIYICPLFGLYIYIYMPHKQRSSIPYTENQSHMRPQYVPYTDIHMSHIQTYICPIYRHTYARTDMPTCTYHM